MAAALLCGSFALHAQESQGWWEMRVCSDPNNMPFSNRAEQGFENRIAEILADELHAKLAYTWYPQRKTVVQEMLRAGKCDMLMGVVDGLPTVETTLPYYRSSYVFLYRKDAPFAIKSFDDAALKTLKIGVQITGDGAPPPNYALGHRDLTKNLEGYPVTGNYNDADPVLPIITDVVNDTIDVAVLWGPIAGYFANQQKTPLTIVPVSPEFEPPSMAMVASISVGLRKGDKDFSDLVNRALVKRWDDIQKVLDDYHVPLLQLAKPRLSLTEE